MRYCYYCKKAMYTSNISVWINGANYDVHKKCSDKAIDKSIKEMKVSHPK